ncbi:MAG: hypothetical protein EDM05_63555 [Leptolyngbya sp. IPPAS B-1204]
MNIELIDLSKRSDNLRAGLNRGTLKQRSQIDASDKLALAC